MLEEAVQAGRQLCGIPDSAAGGAPAPVAGQWIICLICQETRRLQQLKTEGEVLRRLLDSNRSVLSRDVYEAYAEDASRWSGQPRPVVSEALADAASSRPAGTGAAQFRGQWITWITVENRTVLLAPGHAARMLPSSAVQVRFATQAAPGESLRRAEETGLPWSLAIALTDSQKELTSFAVRRELLVSLLALVTALGTGASYLAWRLVQRELALTRMQSDILAAVSHEFRTPLTSMRQISAALSEGRVSGDARRQMYYDALSRATARLHGLVETLLDFSRMESQAMPFRMESIDLSALTSRAVADFETETASGGFTLHTDVPSEEVAITGDAEALRRALWNLMENAFKYSGGSREAWVRLFRNGKEAALSVIDRGIGIPRGEQRDIFRKFFRGAAARESNTRGSGIGLSMVRHIVRAHHGRVTLESQPGAGSTFTMYLPLED
ncbi:MAG: HAMP domain-containing histidine kinase [Bryobacterales bacterium]|nr:HAMP domain-containing histidine kinase [Bryobacterales bacterium]